MKKKDTLGECWQKLDRTFQVFPLSEITGVTLHPPSNEAQHTQRVVNHRSSKLCCIRISEEPVT